MDLIKIGKYIAGKRKSLGLTQKQLAEKLGMSDKSVSKWERGVCLPDVSVYMELCDLLKISVNEFLAGEDIAHGDIRKKSEDNLIQIFTDSKRRQKHLKQIIAVLIILVVLTVGAIGAMVYKANRPQNYIFALAYDSVEMKTAELLSGTDGAFIYKYTASDKFKELTVYISEYQAGKLVNKKKAAALLEGIKPPSNGVIMIVPDFEAFTVKLIIADNTSKFSTDIPILNDVKDREYYGRSATQIEKKAAIKFNEEQGLAALIYDSNNMSVVPIAELEKGKFNTENDYTYYFSFEFSQ